MVDNALDGKLANRYLSSLISSKRLAMENAVIKGPARICPILGHTEPACRIAYQTSGRERVAPVKAILRETLSRVREGRLS